jgi:chemotaxis protein CheC
MVKMSEEVSRSIQGPDREVLDGFMKIAETGTEHAVRALSEMLDARVEMRIPNIKVELLEEAISEFSSPDLHVGVFLGIEGEIKNNFLVLISEKDAIRLTSMLLMEDIKELDMDPDSMTVSALKEIGNILASSFSDGISESIGGSYYPTPSDISFDLPQTLIGFVLIQFTGDPDEALVFHTTMTIDDREFQLSILMAPPRSSREELFKKVQEKERS